MKLISVLILLMVLTGCVSRTMTEPSKTMNGNDVELGKEIIWFWESDY